MPRNGSGTYTLPAGINPVVTQTLITSNWANTTLSDVANALTNSIAKDGQTIPTADLPMGGHRFTNVGDPIDLQDLMTLKYSQQGLQTRLTSVSGINGITANLVGGATTFAVGQLVQLVPAATNTGPVTISINGSPAAAILSATGSPLGPTNLQTGRVYLLSWNGTAWNILTSPDITSFAQSAISGWDRPAGGIYPDVTVVNANTIAIPAGSGRIIKPSTRDITGVTNVSWAAQNYVLTNIANSWETTIGINANGQVVEFIGNVNPAWARTNIILCTVGHINGSIQFISNKPLIFGDVAYMAYDLGIMFHNTLLKGGRMTGNLGNPLHLDIAAGTLWVVGGAADNADSPNFLNFPNMPNINFWPVTANNTVGAVTQTVPVGFYDPGGAGAVVAIPGAGTNTVIHRLWLLAGQIVFTYGQIVYANLDTAVAALDSDNTFFIPPPKLTDATLIGYIIARKDTTDLNDFAFARLLNTSEAGGGGGGGGTGITDAPLDGRTYGRNNGAWVTSVDAVIAGSNVTVDATNPNKPQVSVPSGNIVAGDGIALTGTATNRLVGAVGNLTVAVGSILSGVKTFTSDILMRTATPEFQMVSPAGTVAGGRGYRILSNVNDGVDNGLLIQRWDNVGLVWTDVIAWDVGLSTIYFTVNGYQGVRFNANGEVEIGRNGTAGGIRLSRNGGDPYILFTRDGLDRFQIRRSASPGNGFGVYDPTGAQLWLEADANGRVTAPLVHNNAGGTTTAALPQFASGTYTPVATLPVNCTATPGAAQWQRCGNVVTVSGNVLVDPVTANAAVTFNLSLPIASNFVGFAQCCGAGVSAAVAPNPFVAVQITGDTTNDAAAFGYNAGTDVAARNVPYTYTYVVV